MSDYCKTRCACGWSYACANQHECDEALERHNFAITLKEMEAAVSEVGRRAQHISDCERQKEAKVPCSELGARRVAELYTARTKRAVNSGGAL